MNIDEKKLIEYALDVRKKAYSPYSNYQVGAALLTKDGKIYTGCNVESATYTPTNCGERTAVFKAISEGDRDFIAIAVVGGHKGDILKDYAWPCGPCRQVLAEFCDLKTFKVIVAKSVDDYVVYTLDELLPHAFTPLNLEK